MFVCAVWDTHTFEFLELGSFPSSSSSPTSTSSPTSSFINHSLRRRLHSLSILLSPATRLRVNKERGCVCVCVREIIIMAGSRNHASPMDWSYDNQYGPSDPSSPFSRQNIERQMSQGGPPRKRHYGETAITPIKDRQFDLTTPSSKPYFFTPFQNPLDSSAFKTARDLRSPSVNSDAEDSPAPNVAGMESMMTDDTPTKPPPPPLMITDKKKEDSGDEVVLDLDATPDGKPKKQEGGGGGGGGKGLFGSFGFLPQKKSGKGETKAHKFSDKAAKKVEKKRRQQQKQGSNGNNNNNNNQTGFWVNSGDSYDDDDSDSPFAPINKRRHQKVLPDRTWAETHRDIPQVLSQYLQLTVNILIAALGCYLVYLIVITIQRDVDRKIQDYTAIAQLEVTACNAKLLENRCQPGLMVPGMADQCMKWRACAEKDPYNTGKSQVSAETFAEIINGFVEPISYKSMVFCMVLVFGCVFFSNFAFGFFRAKVGGHPAPVMAAAAPRFVEYGGAAGVVHHSYPGLVGNGGGSGTAIFATPAAQGTRHQQLLKGGKTPFFTARKIRIAEDYGEEEEDEEPASPSVVRRRVLF
ncbi:hypothetical protein TWF730_007229 [Orbilia blumenaviensis]|uniref:Brl1/Brr6 domain-containing protein n=1 Tax=Orbilia blumenaviensis TaxID=1796055 RepID=A0AAV9V8Y3_9PEZI